MASSWAASGTAWWARLQNDPQQALVAVLADVLGVACSVTGRSPEQLEALIRAHPIAFFFAVATSLVMIFDVLLPTILFPFKLLSRSAEKHGMERESREAEVGDARAIKKVD
mmetsp:Transcript_43042/g.106203  ORF Transcript_43042/g.106203 Transcript_43042/m.106203 type:complete len:112 (-) Transcript_43042:491-826(-)